MSNKKNAVSLFYGDSGYEEVMNGINSPDGAVLFGVDDDTTDMVTSSYGNDWCRATFRGKKNTYVFDSTNGWITKENKLPCYHKPVDGINIDDLNEEIMERIEAGVELPRLNENDDAPGVVLGSMRQYVGGPLMWGKLAGIPVPPIGAEDPVGLVPTICPKPMGGGKFVAWQPATPLIVNINGVYNSLEGTIEYSATKTYEELEEAYQWGREIIFVYAGFEGYAKNAAGYSALICGINEDNQPFRAVVTIDSEGVSVAETDYAALTIDTTGASTSGESK